MFRRVNWKKELINYFKANMSESILFSKTVELNCDVMDFNNKEAKAMYHCFNGWLAARLLCKKDKDDHNE